MTGLRRKREPRNSGPSSPVEELFFSGSVGPLEVDEFRFPVSDPELVRVTLQELAWLDAEGEPVVTGGTQTLPTPALGMLPIPWVAQTTTGCLGCPT